MILVVVFVHAISADQKQVLDTISVVANRVETVISSEVGWIGLWHSRDMSIQHIFLVQNADSGNLFFGQIDHCFIAQVPDGIGLVAEVLEANPGLRWIGDHGRTPVIKDLQATDLHVGLLDVDPVVLERAAIFLMDSELRGQQAYSDEVAINETIADGTNLLGRGN